MRQEVTPIRILDLGCGDGGNYILNQGEGVSYVLVDRRLNRGIVSKYPDALWVVSNIQYLPFPDGIFNKLETRFPSQTLVCPGLQRIAGVNKFLRKVFTWVKTDEDQTWYPEFARVLQAGGTLTIWSEFIDIRQVVIDSSSFFEVVNIEEEVTRKELEEMGSFGCKMWSQKMEENSQDKTDSVKKIILKKKIIAGR